MTKAEIIQQLLERHNRFADFICALPDEDFVRCPEGKWTPGQQLDHIRRSVRPLALGLNLPKFVLKLVFGKANRPSRTYEAIVERYHLKLERGGRATGPFIPKAVDLSKRASIRQALENAVISLTNKISRYSEAQLDGIILPHPLLGKVTLREMMYFTIYHVQHHEELTKKYLAM